MQANSITSGASAVDPLAGSDLSANANLSGGDAAMVMLAYVLYNASNSAQGGVTPPSEAAKAQIAEAKEADIKAKQSGNFA